MNMKKNAFSLLLFMISFASFAQHIATGYVFEDLNENGKKERKEKGISNVAVSNGVEVTLTNDKGFYSLPVSGDNTIFAIKPRDYRFGVDENYIPLYYYHYKPAGSSDSLKYEGVTPTGKLPKSIDFALQRYDEPEDFTAIIFGDPQPYSIRDMDYFTRKIIHDVQKTDQMLFGISLGDIVGDNLDLQPVYKERMRSLQLPWYNVMGNHDMNYDAKSDAFSDETFEKNFGTPNYAFNYGEVHFIILDNILYPDPRDGKGYWGGFRKDQLDFVENDLQFITKEKLIVISFHIPLMDEESIFRSSDRQRLFDILRDYENILFLSAHTHLQQQIFHTENDGWKGKAALHEYNVGTTSGDWYSGELDANGNPDATMRDGTPQGYAFLNIKGNKYNFDYKVAGKKPDYQIQVFAPKVVPYKGRTSSLITANFFIGSKDNIVEYRIDDQPWRKMHYTLAPDPAFLIKLFKWDLTKTLLTGRRPSNPDTCTHLWTAGINTHLNPGEHTIEIRATDMYGKQHFAKESYLILQEAN